VDFYRILDHFAFRSRKLHNYFHTCHSIFILLDARNLIEVIAARLILMLLIFGSLETTIFAETPVLLARRIVDR